MGPFVSGVTNHECYRALWKPLHNFVAGKKTNPRVVLRKRLTTSDVEIAHLHVLSFLPSTGTVLLLTESPQRHRFAKLRHIKVVRGRFLALSRLLMLSGVAFVLAGLYLTLVPPPRPVKGA